MRPFLLLAVCAGLGCFSPKARSCRTDLDCAGLFAHVCSQGICVLDLTQDAGLDGTSPDGSSADGAVGDGAILDGASFDAPPPVTIELGERPSAHVSSVTIDTHVQEFNPSTTAGASTTLLADGAPVIHLLLRFDLSSIPSSATVQAADLLLETTSDNLGSGGVALHRVLEEWDEASASWTARTSQNWSTAGVGAPLSRESTAMVSFTPLDSDMAYTVALGTSVVQGWVSSPSTNFGMVLVVSGGSDVTFYSSESSTAAKRPALRVTYR